MRDEDKPPIDLPGLDKLETTHIAVLAGGIGLILMLCTGFCAACWCFRAKRVRATAPTKTSQQSLLQDSGPDCAVEISQCQGSKTCIGEKPSCAEERMDGSVADSAATVGGRRDNGWVAPSTVLEEEDPYFHRSVSAESGQGLDMTAGTAMHCYVPASDIRMGPIMRPQGSYTRKVVRTAIMRGRHEVVAIRHLDVQEPPTARQSSQMLAASNHPSCCAFRGWTRTHEGHILLLMEALPLGTLSAQLMSMAHRREPLHLLAKLELLEQVGCTERPGPNFCLCLGFACLVLEVGCFLSHHLDVPDASMCPIQICSGAAHVSSNGLSFEGHLAAHNVLLHSISPPVVKLSGFGLEQTMAVPAGPNGNPDEHLRSRWLPPEALHSGSGSMPTKWLKQKADVWSWGITAWQVFSDGALPYQGITRASDVSGKASAPPPSTAADMKCECFLCTAGAK